MPGFQSTRLATEGALEPFFFLYTDDSIQGNPETCNQSSMMLNYEVKNILSAVEAGEWLKLELLYAYYQYFGGSWDEAEPDKQEMDQVYQKICSNTPGILHRSSDHEEERE